MSKVPAIVTTGQGLEHFSTFGKLKRAFMLFDVVFVYQGETLHHYQGILGGWQHFKAIPMPETECETYIETWAKG